MSPSDRELVERFLAARDEAAFCDLYDRHAAVMYRCALRHSASPEAAEGAVQEAWLRAARALERFEWRSALRSWLVGITLNCCREQLRRRLRLVPLEEAGHGSSASTPAAAPAVGRIDLQRALAELPEGAREVLLLHDMEGLTHQEIGEALGVSPGTSKSQLSRARSLLRRALA